MRRIYKIGIADNCTILAPVLGDEAILKYGFFEGEPKLREWQPMECCIYRPRKKMTDFATIALVPVLLSERADHDAIMRKQLVRSCELLPLRMSNSSPSLIHSTTIVDCLDEGRSTIDYLETDVWAFHQEKLPLSGRIFRLGGYRVTVSVILTDSSLPPEEDFYQWYHKQGYTGLRFKLLWQSA